MYGVKDIFERIGHDPTCSRKSKVFPFPIDISHGHCDNKHRTRNWRNMANDLIPFNGVLDESGVKEENKTNAPITVINILLSLVPRLLLCYIQIRLICCRHQKASALVVLIYVEQIGSLPEWIIILRAAARCHFSKLKYYTNRIRTGTGWGRVK